MTDYTRREVKWLTPVILGQFHALIMENNQAGFEKLLDAYPHISDETRRELIEEFKRNAENQMRRRWLPSK
jgi:predicted deacetylase